MLKNGDKVLIQKRRGILVDSPSETVYIATVVDVGKVWAKLDRAVYARFKGCPGPRHWPADWPAATEDQVQEAQTMFMKKREERRAADEARNTREQSEGFVLRRRLLGAVEHEDIPVERMRLMAAALEGDEVIVALRLALAEMLHLGAEEEDIDGVRRESEACVLVRALITRRDGVVAIPDESVPESADGESI